MEYPRSGVRNSREQGVLSSDRLKSTVNAISESTTLS
jgi:hypothetical protein